MTRGTRNGLILAAIHLAIVGSLGVKLLADRAMLPRAWVRAAPVDPNLPIRGRYVQIRPEPRGARAAADSSWRSALAGSSSSGSPAPAPCSRSGGPPGGS